jgi:hypothetical protein
MAATVIERGVLELGVDGSKLAGDVEKALKGVGARIKNALGKDLKSAFSGIEDAVGGFKDLAGASSPLGNALGGVMDRVKSVGGAFGALGPAGIVAATAIAGVAAAATAAVAAIAAVGAAVYSWTRQAADAGDQLNTLMNRFSLSAETLSEYKYIAEQTDVSLDAITASIFKLGQTVSEGGKKTAAAARAIGSSLGELRNMRQEDAFKTIISGLSQIPDAGQRAAAGVAFFGKRFMEIAPLVTENMDELARNAKEDGAILSTEFALAGDRMNDALGRIGQVLTGLKNTIGGEFVPVAIALAETFHTHLVKALGIASDGFGDFTETVGNVAVFVGRAIAAIVQIAAEGAKAWVSFWIDAGIRFAGFVESIGGGVTAVGKLLNALSYLRPELADAAAAALKQGDAIEQWARDGVKGMELQKAAFGKYADAVRDAAFVTGVTLPTAVAKVKNELKQQADERRKLLEQMAQFGQGLDEEAAGNEKAAAAIKKANAERAESAAQMRAAGLVLDDFATRFQTLEQQMDAFHESIPQLSLLDVLTPLEGFNGATEVAATNAGLLEDAFKTLGITSRAELQAIADNAKKAYDTIAQQLGKTSPDAIAAFKKWEEASAAAAGTVPGHWARALEGVEASMMAFAELGATWAERAANAVGGIFDGFAGAVMGNVGELGDALGGKLSKIFGKSGFGGMLGGFLGDIVSGGISALASLALQKIGQWIGNLINKPSMKANDERDVAMTDIASRFGGTGLSGTGAGTDFAIVAEQLHKATGSNALFEKFLKADTPEKFAAALREVEAALAAYEKRLETTVQAEKEHDAAIEAVRAEHQKRIDDLEAQAADVNKQIADWDAREAPEAVMGAVEAAARAELAQQQQAIQAALQAERQAMEAALAAVTAAGTAAAGTIGDAHKQSWTEAEAGAMNYAALLLEWGRQGKFDVNGTIRLTPDVQALGVPSVPSLPVTPAARGFDGMVHRPTLFLTGEAGSEHVKVTPGGKPSGSTTINLHVSAIDGASVERLVRSDDFRHALINQLRRNESQFGMKVAEQTAHYFNVSRDRLLRRR